MGVQDVFGREFGIFACGRGGDDGAFEPEVDDQPGGERREEDRGSGGEDLAQGVDVGGVVDVRGSHGADMWGVEEENVVGESVDGCADRCYALPQLAYSALENSYGI